MAYQICKRCGKMFERNGKLYCESCFEKNERDFELIINHLKNHPEATVLDIITETGVSLKSVNCLVEQGGISYAEDKLNINNSDESSASANKTLLKAEKFHITRKY